MVACDGQVPRPTACVTMTEESRLDLAKRALLSELASFAAKKGGAKFADRGRIAVPYDFGWILTVYPPDAEPVLREMQLVSRTFDKAGEIEFFRFHMAMNPQFDWWIALAHKSAALSEACPTNFSYEGNFG